MRGRRRLSLAWPRLLASTDARRVAIEIGARLAARPDYSIFLSSMTTEPSAIWLLTMPGNVTL